jgi:peptide deformylase
VQLRQPCAAADPQDRDLPALIKNMWDTMHAAKGSGLAANQVGVDARLFVIDSQTTFDHMPVESRSVYYPGDHGIREVFINPCITSYSSREWEYEEGCLSIPGIHVNVTRPWSIHIEYLDQQLQPQSRFFEGLTARMILHEYDHLEGVLLTDYIKSWRLKLLQYKLKRISKGRVKTAYEMKGVKSIKV